MSFLYGKKKTPYQIETKIVKDEIDFEWYSITSLATSILPPVYLQTIMIYITPGHYKTKGSMSGTIISGYILKLTWALRLWQPLDASFGD